MEANEYQVGGDHYNNKPYQHWDFVIDTNQPYLIACATKYVSRWREKNGLKDLEKAKHYLEKAIQRKIQTHMHESYAKFITKFISQFEHKDMLIIVEIVSNDFVPAIKKINALIKETELAAEESGATSAYVNQDK